MSDGSNMTHPAGSANVPGPREKRRTSLSYILFSLFVTLLGIAVIGGLLLVYGSQQLAKQGPLKAAKVVKIDRGASTSAIAGKLAGDEVISNERVFFLAALARGRMGDTLKAGEYQFSPGDSMGEVLNKITSGKALAYKVSIPEGLTSQQVLERLNAQGTLTGQSPVTVAEGVLLPDTYIFTRGTTRADLLEQMRAAQVKLLDELWEKRVEGLPLKSKEEALILASIVEKETGVASERARVAAVFHNRLIQNIRLQSDPTIIYGIVGGKGKMDRPIRRSDIDNKTAYNTYQIDGLPPAPIANPGRAAIAAVLNPASSNELYFVADGSGGHAFAKTLAEHQENVRRWRKLSAKEKLAAASPEAAPKAATPETTGSAAPATEETSEAPKAAETAGTEQSATPAPDPEPVSPDQELPVAGAEASDAARVAQGKVPLPRRKPSAN